MKSFEEFAKYVLKNSKHNENPSNRVHIIVDYPKIEWDDWAEYMTTLTWFSGIPLSKGGSKNSHVIFAKTIDEALNQTNEHFYDYAMISYIGSFYHSEHDENIHMLFDKFCSSGKPCRGHLLFHPNKSYGRLHPQTIFLNLKHWKEIGKPSFGKYTGNVINYNRSKSNVHDDYTPHWIKPGKGFKTVINSEQAQYISKVLEDGKKILNFDRERSVKFFCYPERRYSEALEFERNKSSDIIYTTNNEKLSNIPLLDIKFDVIYAPAAGYSAEYLHHFFGHKNTKLVIYDNNKNSVLWKQMVYNFAKTKKDLKRIEDYFRKKGCIIDSCSYKKDVVEKNNSIFSADQWLTSIKKINPQIIEHDVLDKPFDVDPKKKNLIYLSNIFSYKFLIHKMKIEDIHNKFKQYIDLPNTTVYGKNIFKDTVYKE